MVYLGENMKTISFSCECIMGLPHNQRGKSSSNI